MNIFANKRINVDCLQYSKPSRERFLEWKKGNINVVHVTLAVWENALETIKVISEWNKLFRENSDLIGLAKSQHDIFGDVSAGDHWSIGRCGSKRIIGAIIMMAPYASESYGTFCRNPDGGSYISCIGLPNGAKQCFVPVRCRLFTVAMPV